MGITIKEKEAHIVKVGVLVGKLWKDNKHQMRKK